jgi:outer membrane protein TolC
MVLYSPRERRSGPFGGSGRAWRHPVSRPGGPLYAVWVLGLGLLLLGLAGCGRAFYRRQADREVRTLVDCDSGELRATGIEGFTIEPNPKSRMYDPFSPDFPPMPPDDPISHRLMQCVDCKRAWPGWACYGKTSYVENPGWQTYLPRNERGEVVLNRNGAMQIALLDSREYQRAWEDVYLSALDVTLQRFQFDAQFFGSNTTSFEAQGPLAGGQSLLSTDNNLQMKKLLAAGGELVVGVANSLVWQFAGPDTYNANTLLSFSLLQPLLRAGGRAVVLESLTSSERALLGGIRGLERFRRSFYVQTITAYLGLLENQVLIRNQAANVSQLRISVERLEAAYEFGGVRRGDLDRTRQSLYSAQSSLLSLNTRYENQLDAYKVTLGLPPALELRIEDPLLAGFYLIAPELTAAEEAARQLAARLRSLVKQGPLAPKDYLEALTSIRQDAAAQLELVGHDMEVLARALPERRKSLRKLAEREAFRRGEVDPTIVDVKALDTRVAALQKRFAETRGKLKGILKGLESSPAAPSKSKTGPGAAAESPDQRLIDLVTELSKDLMELSLDQARARLDTITLIPVDLSPEEALQIARGNRRDWMNARADLVDTWRQIEIRANALRSGLDVTFSGDINTTDNNPVRFRSSTGRLRVGLEFDAPLTRLAERNAYRTALIQYQRARRDYYAFEDGVDQGLRGQLRTIRLNQLNFEIQRAAVLVAIARVDETRLRLDEPPTKTGEGVQYSDSFVERMVSDFSSLLSAQNQFLTVWVDQEVQRMNLELNLGTMQLDANGMWVDPGPIEGARGQRGEQLEEAPLPPGQLERIPAPPGKPAEPDVL